MENVIGGIAGGAVAAQVGRATEAKEAQADPVREHTKKIVRESAKSLGLAVASSAVALGALHYGGDAFTVITGLSALGTVAGVYGAVNGHEKFERARQKSPRDYHGDKDSVVNSEVGRTLRKPFFPMLLTGLGYFAGSIPGIGAYAAKAALTALKGGIAGGSIATTFETVGKAMSVAKEELPKPQQANEA